MVEFRVKQSIGHERASQFAKRFIFAIENEEANEAKGERLTADENEHRFVH